MLHHAQGSDETFETEWLIGCDGAHSTIRHGLGLSFDGDTMGKHFVLADVHLTGGQISEDEVTIVWHADGVLLFFPILDGRYRIIADITSGTPPAEATLRRSRPSSTSEARA